MTGEARRAAAAIDSCICALYHRAVMLAWPPSSGQGGSLWPAAGLAAGVLALACVAACWSSRQSRHVEPCQRKVLAAWRADRVTTPGSTPHERVGRRVPRCQDRIVPASGPPTPMDLQRPALPPGAAALSRRMSTAVPAPGSERRTTPLVVRDAWPTSAVSSRARGSSWTSRGDTSIDCCPVRWSMSDDAKFGP